MHLHSQSIQFTIYAWQKSQVFLSHKKNVENYWDYLLRRFQNIIIFANA